MAFLFGRKRAYKTTPSLNIWAFHINGIFYLAENGHIKQPIRLINGIFFPSVFFSFSGFVSVCFMSSLYDISTLCIRFTWLIMTPTVLVTACFVNLVRKLSDSIFLGSCDICFAPHYSDSLDRPSDYTPGTVLRTGGFFFLANLVCVHMSSHKFPILFCLCQVRPLS